MQVIKKTNFKGEATYDDIRFSYFQCGYGVHAELLYARFFVLSKQKIYFLGMRFILIESQKF